MTRADLAAQAAALRAQGLTYQRIADTLGISLSYACELMTDPDGAKAKARKDRYRGTCENCGARTDGSNGRRGAPKLCAACTKQRQHDERYWTQERIIQAIRDWTAAHDGEPPAATDWNGYVDGSPAGQARLIAALTKWPRDRIIEAVQEWAAAHGRPPRELDWLHADPAGRHPSRTVVVRRYGWANLIEEAGFPRPTRGRPRRNGRATRTGGPSCPRNAAGNQPEEPTSGLVSQ